MLAKKYKVIATEKNYNTPMGIALSVDRIEEDTDIIIAEIGARRQGDVSFLAEKIKPDYSLTTGVCPQHLETFKSVHNIYNEKYDLNDHKQT